MRQALSYLFLLMNAAVRGGSPESAMAKEDRDLRKAGLKVTVPRVKILQMLEARLYPHFLFWVFSQLSGNFCGLLRTLDASFACEMPKAKTKR